MNQKRVEELIGELLGELGEDTARDGLKKTPARVAQAPTAQQLAAATQGQTMAQQL